MEVTIRPGNYYLIHERRPHRVFELYKDFKHGDRPVICVSRIHPDQLREEFGIEREDTLWLSNTPGPRNVNPLNVGILTDRLIRFFEENDGVVLMEGLEYIAIQNDFEKVLRLINYLYEAVAINKTILLVSIDERAFNPRELAFMERSAVVVEEGDSMRLSR